MGFLEDRDLSGVPSIREFYRGKTIFITGGSGFMGQCLIEKLLYSCSDLERICLLIRPKREKTSRERVLDMYSEMCFDRVRKERPGLYESKVFAIKGDVTEKELGLSTEDRKYLVDHVNIIFNSAASVRFDDTLLKATDHNVKSAVNIVNLAKQMKKLVAMVHVSTCYSNTNQGSLIEEKLYPPHVDWKELVQICDNVEEETINIFTERFIGSMPNTYVFTKQLGEHVMSEQRGLLPAVIARPSVVVNSLQEPMVGWINNFNGPIALQIGGGKGVISVIYGDPDNLTDYIPVDVCIKHFISAAWIRGTKKLEASDDVPIYNCSNNSNYEYSMTPITLYDTTTHGFQLMNTVPLESAIGVPGALVVNSHFIFYIVFMIVDLTRGVLIDAILKLCGKKPMLVKILRKFYKAQVLLNYYLSRTWTFDNKNFHLLCSRIKDEDKSEFSYKYSIDVKKYYENAVYGTKLYLLDEKLENIPATLKYNYRLKLILATLKVLVCSYAIWLFYKTSFIQNLL